MTDVSPQGDAFGAGTGGTTVGLCRLLVVVTHPIQYFSPWWRHLAAQPDFDLTVVYLRELDEAMQGVGFGQRFRWDVPLREGYRSIVLGAPPRWRALVKLPLLIATLRRLRPDAVLVTGWQEPLLALALPLSRWAAPLALVRGESNDLRPRQQIARVAHRAMLAFVHGALAIGLANARFFRNAGVPAERIVQAGYFVENERLLADLEAQERHRAAVRGEEGATDSDFVVAFCGKLVPFKRPDLLLEAAGLLRQEGVPIRLRYAGSGELRGELERRAAELGVAVHFTGFLNQTQMWRAYLGADLFVLPSTAQETWGLVVNEAMVFGLPVAVSDQVGSGEDLVIEGVTGWRFSGGADALARTLRQAWAGRDRLPAMGKAAQNHVLRNYSIEAATRGLRRLIEGLRT